MDIQKLRVFIGLQICSILFLEHFASINRGKNFFPFPTPVHTVQFHVCARNREVLLLCSVL
jgi:hypothetical protein